MFDLNPLYMSKFRAKWKHLNCLSLSATNPQPFTLDELNQLLGENILNFDPQMSLDYGNASGLPALRHALKTHLFPSLEEENIITSAGAQEGIFVAMHALLKKGDEVISFSPIFEPLIKCAQDLGCKVQLLPLSEERGWTIDFNRFEELVSENTKMVIINFPHNPTGAHLRIEELEEIISICRRKDVWLFSDEVFRGLEHEPKNRLPAVASMYEKGISIGVVSKSHGTPAFRVGWIASPSPRFLKNALLVKGYLSICNDLFSEHALVPVINHSNLIFETHRKGLVENLKKLDLLAEKYPHFSFVSPEGGCTVFASCGQDSDIFADALAKDAGLLVIPGKAFCSTSNAFRLGYSFNNFGERLVGFDNALSKVRT